MVPTPDKVQLPLTRLEGTPELVASLLQQGENILVHKDLKSTMIYTHVADLRAQGTASPVDPGSSHP